MTTTRIVFTTSTSHCLYRHAITERHLQYLLDGSQAQRRQRIRALGGPITGVWHSHPLQGRWFLPDGVKSYAKEAA